MSQFFTDGGPWMIIISALAFSALVLNIVQLSGKARRDLTPVITGTIAATVLVGVCATGAGLIQAGLVIPRLVESGEVEPLGVIVKVVQISLGPTVLASLLSAVNAVLGGLGRTLRARPA